jgi:hypothetical protein
MLIFELFCVSQHEDNYNSVVGEVCVCVGGGGELVMPNFALLDDTDWISMTFTHRFFMG